MSQGPSCPNCRGPLRWFAQLQQWGCDRCQVMVAAQAIGGPDARSRNTLWIVLGALAVVGGGVAVAILTVGNKTNGGSPAPPTPAPVAGSAAPKPDAAIPAPTPVPPATIAQGSALPKGVQLGPPEQTEVGDFWLVPRSDGEYVITSPLVTATFPSKPAIKVAKATTVNADGKPFDIYSFAVEKGAVLYQLQVIALGRNARDEGGFAKVEQELGKLGQVTKVARKGEDGQDITRFTVSQGGSTLLLDGRIDLPRGLLVNSTTVTDAATKAVGDQFLASVRIKRPPDPLDDPNTLVGVRVRKAGKKLVAHDKTDSFTIELPWQPTVVRTPDPATKHDVEVALTATKGKSTIAFVVQELSPWDALSKSPTKIASLEHDDLASMEKLAGGKVAIKPFTMGGLTGSKIEPVGRAKQKVSSYLVLNRFQHRMYRLVCLDQPCDAVAKSLHFADTPPEQP